MTGIAAALLLAWMQTCSLHYGVEPEFAYAVARVESGTKTEALRCGRLGRSRYYGPMGINRCFLGRWPIDDPYVNVEVGGKALRGADKRRVLKRYNAAFNEAYYRAVMSTYRQAKREGRFDGECGGFLVSAAELPCPPQRPLWVTLDWLQEYKACQPGLRWFSKRYPKGAGFHRVLISLRRNGHFTWAIWLENHATCLP